MIKTPSPSFQGKIDMLKSMIKDMKRELNSVKHDKCFDCALSGVKECKHSVCTICTNNIEWTSDLTTQRLSMMNPCKHVFHTACIKGWHATSLQCPNCRVDSADYLVCDPQNKACKYSLHETCAPPTDARAFVFADDQNGDDNDGAAANQQPHGAAGNAVFLIDTGACATDAAPPPLSHIDRPVTHVPKNFVGMKHHPITAKDPMHITRTKHQMNTLLRDINDKARLWNELKKLI
jgi:hypothetical protein